MRKVGVTTVQRWLSEKYDKSIQAYMQSEGELYKLVSVTGGNGAIGVTLSRPFKLHEASYFAGRGGFTLQSVVYLYAGEGDLTGLSAEGIELTELGTTLARVTPEFAGGTRFNIEGTTGGRVVSAAADPQVPCHPHCG